MTSPRSYKPLLLAIVAGLAVFACLQVLRTHEYRSSPAFRAPSGAPILLGLDGYRYLRQARDLVESQNWGGVLENKVPVPSLMVAAADATGVAPFEWAAHWLPLVLGAATMVALAFAGGLLGGCQAAFLAILGACGCLMWMHRSVPGWYDTDPLNLFFPLLCGLCMARHAELGKDGAGAGRWWWMLSAAAWLGLYAAWWPSGATLFGAIFLVLYALTLTLSASRAELAVKALMLAGMAASFYLIATNQHHGIPLLDRIGDRSIAQLQIYLRQGGSQGLESVGWSIAELAPVTLDILAEDMGGSLALFCIALAGMAVAFINNPRVASFVLLPFVAAMLMAITGRRFLLLIMPAYALGLAALGSPQSRPWRFACGKLPSGAGKVLAAAVFVGGIGLTAIGVRHVADRALRPANTGAQALLADQISKIAASDALVWNFWDQGYFVKYYSRREVVVDNGSQTPLRTVVTSMPLAARSNVQALGLMNFYASNGLGGFEQFMDAAGNVGRGLPLLAQVMSEPERAAELLNQAGVRDAKTWADRLLAKGQREVYLFLTGDLLQKNWWYYYGTRHLPGVSPTPLNTMLVPRAAGQLDLQAGTLTTPQGEEKLAAVIRANTDQVEFVRGADPRARNVGIDVAGSPDIMVVHRRMFETLLGRLLFVAPHETPGFSTVIYSPIVGGVWKCAVTAVAAASETP